MKRELPIGVNLYSELKIKLKEVTVKLIHRYYVTGFLDFKNVNKSALISINPIG